MRRFFTVVIFVLSLCALIYFIKVRYAPSSQRTYVRVYDLGGSGLKTALLSFDKSTQTMTWIEPKSQLGKCPDYMEPDLWIRSRMQELLNKKLDEEIRSGYEFGFSLAGLNKLRRSKPLSTTNLSLLFRLPHDKVRCIDDGAAHLVASLNTLKDLPKGPIWNFSIGTGVGTAFTDSNHTIRNLSDLFKFFGCAPWMVTEPGTGLGVWKACGSQFGFDQIVANNSGVADESAFLEFASRWKAYIQSQVLGADKTGSLDKSWGIPTAIVFTGGFIDTYGNRLVDKLHELKITIPVYTGPKNAGLLGAAWNTVNKGFDQPPLLQSILSQNAAKAEQLLAHGSDVNELDALGNTPLSAAITTGQLEIVKLLLKQGADINEYDFGGRTPLFLAVQSGNHEIAKYLLEKGAHVDAEDSWDRTARLIARTNNDHRMEELIQQNQAMPQALHPK